MEALARTLIVAGVLLIAVGILLYANPPWNMLGKLPGDIRIERDNFRLYLPVTTCLLLSVALSAVLWLLSKWR